MYRGTIGSIEVACLGQFSHVLYNPATSLERVRHSWRKPPSHLQVNLQVSVGKWKAVCKVDHIIVILGNVRKRECEVPASRAGQYRNRTVWSTCKQGRAHASHWEGDQRARNWTGSYL